MLRSMGAPRIAASATAVPAYRWDQAALLQLSGYDGQRAGFFSNSQIDGRYLYLDPETFTPNESVDQLNEHARARIVRGLMAQGFRTSDILKKLRSS